MDKKEVVQKFSVDVKDNRPMMDLNRREHWLIWISGLVLLCCLVTGLPSLLLPHSGLPSAFRATLCLDLARDPVSFSLWWISPNLTSLPYQPMIVSNRIEYCFFTSWLFFLPPRGGFDLR